MRQKTFNPQDIAEKAMHVFWQKGYAATSVQDLVDGTSLSRSSLYDTFGSKEALYHAALRHYMQTVTSNTSALCTPDSLDDKGGGTLDGIGKLLRHLAQDELTCPTKRGCFAMNASLEGKADDNETQRILADNAALMQDILAKLIAHGQATGEIRTDKAPKALARFVHGMTAGIRVLGKSVQDDKAQVLDDMIDVALSALSA